MIGETGMANLRKVDHMVVLMLENRSFDHMLGYLSLEGGRTDVDGLRAQFANEHDGRRYPVHHLASTAIPDDPDHSAERGRPADRWWLDGWLRRKLRRHARKSRSARRGSRRGDGLLQQRGRSGLRSSRDEFAICDRWFSSVPGATWPNRLYAICGRAARSRDDLPPHVPPLYNHPSFVRHLDAHDISWRWYSFEGGTLRFADAHYLLGHHDRFAFFSKTNLNWKTKLEVRTDAEAPSFLEDAASGALPSVSWIDPNFSNFNPIGFQTNDDHAPADIKDGQELVLAVYHALATSPQWEQDTAGHLLRRARRLL